MNEMEQFSITGWRRYALVQPPMMLLILGVSMSGNILTDLIVYRTCTVTLGMNKTECSLLHENSSCAEALKIDTQAQPQASLMLMAKSFIDSIFPAFLSLFLGPWSDKYGRKPLILSGFIGMSLTFSILSVIAALDISPWFFLIAYVPSACLGGFCILILGCICYISDISNQQDRAWQLAWLNTLISVGVLLGIFAGPLVFRLYGYIAVFGSATVSSVLGGLYVLFFVPETIHNNNPRTVGSLFDVDLVKDLVNTCTKKRDGFDRYVVWSCIACLTLLIVTLQGEINVGFLFTSARLGWNVDDYSLFMGINIILSIFGTIFGMKVLKACGGLSEELTCILAVLSSFGGALTRSFTWKSWHMYLSIAIDMFSDIVSPTIRAILSKAVPSQDAGKVFSLTVSIETLTPFGASSLYGMVYSNFMPPVYPSPVWLVSAGIFAIVAMILINVRVRRGGTNAARYTILTQDSEQSS